MAYESKEEKVRARQLAVQKLSIPFTLTHHATPASVVLRNDEPGVMFIKSEGVDQITTALASNETATFVDSPVDANGILNVLVKIAEPVKKIVSCRMVSLATGVSQPLYRGSSTGISTGTAGGKSIMLTLDSAVNHATTDVDGVIEVAYQIDEQA